MAQRDPITGRFINNNRADEKKSAPTISYSTATSAISDVLKRNPDLLYFAEAALNSMPGAREAFEQGEISILRKQMASRTALYMHNRQMILALYTRFGFDAAAKLVADDILHG